MRKITKITSVSTGIISLLLGNTALAQTTEMDSYKLLPSGVHVVGQLNASERHPFESLLNDAINSMDMGMTSQDKPVLSAELKKFLSSASYTFATRMRTEDGMNSTNVFMLIKASKAQADMFAKFMSSTLSNANVTTETYKNVEITHTVSEYGSSTSTAYIKGHLVLSESMEGIKEMIDMSEKATTSSSFVKEQTGHDFLPNNFFNMYIDPSYIESMWGAEAGMSGPFEMFGNPEYQKKVFAAVKAEAISFAQTDKGLKYNVIVKAKDAESLKTLGVDPVKNSFVPSIYNYVSGKNLLMYSEQKQGQTSIEQMLMMLGTEATDEWTDWKASMKSETGMDFDQDIMPLLDDQMGFAVNYNLQEAVPTFTLVVKTPIGSDEKEGVRKMVDLMKQNLDKKGGETYTLKNDGSMVWHVFTAPSPWWTSSNWPEVNNTFTLNIGFNGDDIIFSNAADLTTIYGQSETNLSEVEPYQHLFTSPGEKITNLTFVNFDEIETYGTNLMKMMAKADGEKVDAEMLATFQGFMAPFHTLYGKTYADTDSVWMVGDFEMDFDAFAKYPELMMQGMMSHYEYEEDYGTNQTIEDYINQLGGTKTFCDVTAQDWFYTAVKNLSPSVIKGYDDGCFRPGQNVTRAEFIEMMMKTVEIKKGRYSYPTSSFTNMDTMYETSKQYFIDVPTEGNWFEESVNRAAGNNFISGYEDGSFKPGNFITRAEAALIVAKLPDNNDTTMIQEGNPFTDVKNGDWFYYGADKLYNTGIIKGTTPTTFEPGRNLTRAEAAVLAYKYLLLEY